MKEKAKKKSSGSKDNVTLVQNPFGIYTPEIAEIQNNDDAVIEDDLTDLPAEDYSAAMNSSDEQLEGLTEAMAKEHDKNLVDLKTQAEKDEEDSAKELALQIAEDEALAKLEKEAAEAASDHLTEELNAELAAALPKRNESGELDAEEVQSCVETLLFMSEKPLSFNKLKEYLGAEIESQAVRDAIGALKERYQSSCHGFELQEIAGGYQFRTKAHRAPLAMRLAKVQTQRLSRGAMESLAIIAYKQPAMKDDIDKIRGVDSSHFIRVLLYKKLIQMDGRSELPGRPILYSTTSNFLEIFSLNDLSQLPPLKELEQMIPSSESGSEDEDPKVKEMRRLVSEMKADKHRLAYDPKEDEKLLTDIRERVKGIQTTTPYIDELKLREKAEKEGISYEALLAEMNGTAVEVPAEIPAEPAPEVPLEVTADPTLALSSET